MTTPLPMAPSTGEEMIKTYESSVKAILLTQDPQCLKEAYVFVHETLDGFDEAYLDKCMAYSRLYCRIGSKRRSFGFGRYLVRDERGNLWSEHEKSFNRHRTKETEALS